MEEKIISKEANIESNTWILNDVLFKPVEGVLKKEFKEYKIVSIYDYEKITVYLKISILCLS